MATQLRPEYQEPAELISGVLTDARDLAVAEVDKVKAEVRRAGEAAKITAIGLGIQIVAAVMLGQALAAGLVVLGLPAWSAFAILAALTAVVGMLFVKYPRSVAKAT